MNFPHHNLTGGGGADAITVKIYRGGSCAGDVPWEDLQSCIIAHARKPCPVFHDTFHDMEDAEGVGTGGRPHRCLIRAGVVADAFSSNYCLRTAIRSGARTRVRIIGEVGRCVNERRARVGGCGV